jgi:hypothetical protein
MHVKRVSKSKIPPVPFEYSGKWIAWSADHMRIVAHDDSFPELWKRVREAGVEDPIFEKVPRLDCLFVSRL